MTKAVQIAVLADTHLTHVNQLPPRLLDEVRQADIVIHLGDFISPRLMEQLRRVSREFYGIPGNHDPWVIKNALPREQVIDVNGKRIGLVHGCLFPIASRQVMRRRFGTDRLDALLYGHTHVARNEVIDGILYFNPGSITGKFPAPWKSYGVLTVDDRITGRIAHVSEPFGAPEWDPAWASPRLAGGRNGWLARQFDLLLARRGVGGIQNPGPTGPD
jgi:putative phosphoesterase